MLRTKVLSLFASRNVVYVLVVEVGFARKVPLAWPVPAAHEVCRAFMCSRRIAQRFSKLVVVVYVWAENLVRLALFKARALV